MGFRELQDLLAASVSTSGDKTALRFGPRKLSYRELERRLRSRGLDDAEQIERRLLDAGSEMRYLDHFDYAIVNDDLDRATRALAAILLARRFRRARMQNR